MASLKAATLSGLLAIVLWSSLALLTTATEGLPPFEVLALGFGFAALFGFARIALGGRDGWRELRQPWSALALATAALFGYHALYFMALKRAPAVEANLLNYLWPLLIVLLAGLLPGVRVRGAQLMGTLLGLVGAIVLVTHGSGIEIQPQYLSGYLAALGAAVVWAAYSVLNRRHAQVPSAAIIVACALVAVFGLLAHAGFERTVAPSAKQWLVLAAMGMGPVGAAFLLWDHGTKHGDIAVLGSLSYLAPLLSTLLLVLAGRAEPHWSQAVAIGLLMLGAWLSLRKPNPA
ncbi:aromatic amino acid exporter YddG [Pseudoxanthomonas sacheonensis]|uniref:aromatic amino acid exporter YddG n=1 Tax=Pseudoxanthomonas sacheonensis TaxID=443615 RepID=UPI001BAD2833|nr:EamA family transporter [Pseudoxanthomonas sacheonensis]